MIEGISRTLEDCSFETSRLNGVLGTFRDVHAVDALRRKSRGSG